jgi:hypothetical protein
MVLGIGAELASRSSPRPLPCPTRFSRTSGVLLAAQMRGKRARARRPGAIPATGSWKALGRAVTAREDES